MACVAAQVKAANKVGFCCTPLQILLLLQNISQNGMNVLKYLVNKFCSPSCRSEPILQTSSFLLLIIKEVEEYFNCFIHTMKVNGIQINIGPY